MRVILDLDTGLVSTATDYVPGLNRNRFASIPVTLGDQPLDVQLMRSGVLAQLAPAPGTLKFIASPYNADGSVDFDADNVVSGEFTVTTAQTDPALFPILKCGEDWGAAALVALFTGTDQPSVNLRGQFSWQTASDAGFRLSRDFDISVRNALFDSNEFPGAMALGNRIYLSGITRLSGGQSTDLDTLDISRLPDLTLIEVVIAGRGSSSWRKEVDLTSPTTDLDAGAIVPVDYDPVTRPYVLHRVSGI